MMPDHSMGGYEPLQSSHRPTRRVAVLGGLVVGAILLFLGIRASGSTSVTAGGAKGLMIPTVLFPYPPQAKLTNLVVCNYSGRDWWYTGERKGAPTRKITPVKYGASCAEIPLSDACRTPSCWERGTVSDCDPASKSPCPSKSTRGVTAGVNVVPGGGKGAVQCEVDCVGSKAVCEASSVAFIYDSECSHVRVRTRPGPPPPAAGESGGGGGLPVVTFPYPAGQAKPSDVVVCNFAGRGMWYSWDDSTENKWIDGPDHTPLPPGRHKCTTVATGGLSFHRGFIAPCGKDAKECFKHNVRTVTAGVNVIGVRGEGEAECVVDCVGNAEACRVASVVFVSPSRCQRVSVKVA